MTITASAAGRLGLEAGYWECWVLTWAGYVVLGWLLFLCGTVTVAGNVVELMCSCKAIDSVSSKEPTERQAVWVCGCVDMWIDYVEWHYSKTCQFLIIMRLGHQKMHNGC